MKPSSPSRAQRCALFALSILSASAAHAATLKITPQGAQPGDVLTVTVYPAAGETISGVGMAAFDTSQVKFFGRPDGLARAFVGFPFDRHGGTQTLRARVRVDKAGASREQILSASLRGRDRYYPTQRISMKSSTASMMHDKGALRGEKLHVQSKMKSSYAAPLWQGNWLTPTKGASTSAYGRKRYVNGQWWGQHNGADIKAGSGAPVIASNTGRVVLSEYLPALRGNCIVLDHGCNVFSVYMHLSRREVVEGESVSKGQRIGAVGATGFVTGAHLHWEVRVGWEPVDPSKVVSGGLKF